MNQSPREKAKSVQIRSSVDVQWGNTYLNYLKKDNRLYDDAEVKELPETFFYNLHRAEWERKAQSAKRLMSYLNRPPVEDQKFQLLDMGCGTGWLAAQVAKLPQFEVVGLDIVPELLQQAARVSVKPGLSFVQGDIFEDLFPEEHFDLIILFDVIAYFSNLPQLLNRLRQFLKKGGEIHLLESQFYQEKEIELAKRKTEERYKQLGVPEMVDLHFFHSIKDLSPFDFYHISKSRGFGRWLRSKEKELPWVKIVN